jgi:hypothetical protein
MIATMQTGGHVAGKKRGVGRWRCYRQAAPKHGDSYPADRSQRSKQAA